jgi:hypothetical protein
VAKNKKSYKRAISHDDAVNLRDNFGVTPDPEGDTVVLNNPSRFQTGWERGGEEPKTFGDLSIAEINAMYKRQQESGLPVTGFPASGSDIAKMRGSKLEDYSTDLKTGGGSYASGHTQASFLPVAPHDRASDSSRRPNI